MLIQLTSVSVSPDYKGDKFFTAVIVGGPVWVNANQIKMIQVYGKGDDHSEPYTRVDLGGEDFAYVQEDPQTILVLIDKARAVLAQ